jgi:hypothetical protein
MGYSVGKKAVFGACVVLLPGKRGTIASAFVLAGQQKD